MKINNRILILFCSLVLAFQFSVYGQKSTATVSGVVLSQQQIPIPGLTVVLVHPIVGRSYPILTDNEGRFAFRNVPLREGAYYLEIYWGKQIYHRSKIHVKDETVVVPPIRL